MNSVVLIGRLTRDPEVRYISGKSDGRSRLLPLQSTDRQDPDRKRRQIFRALRYLAVRLRTARSFLAKGRLVGVQGRIQTGSYTNRDGATVYTTDVVADRVEFLEWGDRAPRSGGTQADSRDSSMRSRSSHQSYDDRDNGVPEGFQAITDDDIPF